MKRSRMKARGKLTDKRLSVTNPLLRAQAEAEGWLNVCEIRPLLVERGFVSADDRCQGRLTFCHARTRTRRSAGAPLGSPEHELTVCRGCERHHYYVLDIPSTVSRDEACEIVMEAIRRRSRAACGAGTTSDIR